MSYADQAERTATAHPAQAVVVDKAGGVTGLTVVLAVRLGSTVTTPSWLDFADNTFKTAGWTTRQQTLTEVDATNDPGVYALAGGLNINGMTGLPAGERQLVLEHEITAGGKNGVGVDVVVLKDDVDNDLTNLDATVSGVPAAILAAVIDVVDLQTALQEILAYCSGNVDRSGNDFAYRDRADTADLFTLQKNTNSRDRL